MLIPTPSWEAKLQQRGQPEQLSRKAQIMVGVEWTEIREIMNGGMWGMASTVQLELTPKLVGVAKLCPLTSLSSVGWSAKHPE